MKTYIKYLAVGMMAAAISSCGDFLDPKATSEYVPKDAESLNELLLGQAYPRKDIANTLDGFLHLMDDDIAFAPYQTYDNYFENRLSAMQIVFTWQPNMWDQLYVIYPSHNVNQYKAYYSLILGCNAILDYIGQANDSQEEINNVLAQAHALRGYYYFQLVNIFGKPYNSPGGPESLGVPLKLTSNIEEAGIRRNTVGDVYDQVLSDLKAAEELYESLPADMQWKSNFRTSLPMVQLVLSRVYLYMENWAKAALYAEKVMNNSNFKFINVNDVPRMNPNAQSRIYYMNYQSYNSSPEVIMPFGNTADVAFWLFDTPKNGTPCFIASQDLMDSYEDTDLRKDFYIATTKQQDNYPRNWQTLPLGKISLNSQNNNLGSGSDNFGRSFRLSEAYLNYAEAKIELNEDISGVFAKVDLMRKNRFKPEDFKPTPSMSQDAAREFIRAERRRELCYEGHRWFDIRRWGMPEIKHVWHVDGETDVEYTLKAGDNAYTLPIPRTSIELNPDLEQNPMDSGSRPGVNINK